MFSGCLGNTSDLGGRRCECTVNERTNERTNLLALTCSSNKVGGLQELFAETGSKHTTTDDCHTLTVSSRCERRARCHAKEDEENAFHHLILGVDEIIMWLEGETKSEWKIVTFLQLQSDRHPFRVTFFELRKK